MLWHMHQMMMFVLCTASARVVLRVLIVLRVLRDTDWQMKRPECGFVVYRVHRADGHVMR